MQRADAVARITQNADRFREIGVASLYLFGSTVRDEARADSDVDVFVDIPDGVKFSLFDLLELKYRLEDTLGVAADVMTRDSLHPVLRDQILSEAVQVF